MSIPDLNFVVSEDTPIVNEEYGGLHNHLLEENIEIEPEIGMVFDSAENAYTFYNSYARRVGFSVRIFRTNKNKVDSKVIQRQVLVCSCEGFYKKVKTPQKKRDETRCDCKASFAFKRVPNNKYQVIGFEPVHSHDLAPLEHVGYLRSQRKIEFTQAELMTTMHASGLKQGQIFSYMCEEAGGIQNLNFTKSDCNNFLQRRRAEFFKKGDAECLLEYFKQKKEENKHFFYSFRTYEDGEICGVFFCDAKSRRDYGLFGDAICFDTTFRTNKYDMLCAPIVGINHHGQTSLFGCGLLDGETYDAITWLFTTFFEVMGGQKPRSIFTDQSAAISSVVDELLPQSHHGLCLWHLCQNAAKHLGSNGYKTFSSQFKSCIYDPETVEEFEQSLEKFLEENGLQDNEWLRRTYEVRRKWAQVYSRSHFCAGMTTSQRSESINKFLKNYFTHGRIVLQEFVRMYSRAMDDRREKEREAEHKTIQTKPNFISNWSVEREAAKKYTRKIFNLFQQSVKKLIDLSLESEHNDGNVIIYKVREIEGCQRVRTVTYNPLEEMVTCSCRKFEFHGILCSHGLKLFRHLEIKSLPPHYYLKRWTRDSTYQDICDPDGEIIPNDNDPTLTSRYSEISHISQRIISKGSRNIDVFNICKSLLLKVETSIDQYLGTNIDENNLNPVIVVDQSTPNPQIICELRDPKKRRAKSSKRIKSALETRSRKKAKQKCEPMNLSHAMESINVGQGPNESGSNKGSEMMEQNVIYPDAMIPVQSDFRPWF